MTRSAGPAAAPADEAAPARRRRRSSGPRDPLAPKRAHTAFDFFVESRKGALKTANPEIKSAEMIKLLAEEWKAVATADRAPFKAQAAEDRERHEAEMASYVPPASYVLSSVGVAKSGKRLKKDPAKPKRPLTAYIAFLSAERPKLVEKYPDSAGVAALAPKLSAAWAALTPAQRDKYEKQAQADKERFDREMQTYTPSAEYLEAKEQFKQQHGGGGSSTALAEVEAVEVMDEEEEVDEDEEQVMEAGEEEEEEAAEAPASSLAAENQRLKKAVAKQARRCYYTPFPLPRTLPLCHMPHPCHTPCTHALPLPHTLAVAGAAASPRGDLAAACAARRQGQGRGQAARSDRQARGDEDQGPRRRGRVVASAAPASQAGAGRAFPRVDHAGDLVVISPRPPRNLASICAARGPASTAYSRLFTAHFLSPGADDRRREWLGPLAGDERRAARRGPLLARPRQDARRQVPQRDQRQAPCRRRWQARQEGAEVSARLMAEGRDVCSLSHLRRFLSSAN